METNSRYGWGTSGTGIDTHLIKNIEWGAVAYLTRSLYGINSILTQNDSSSYTTGCAGIEIAAGQCQYAYNTTNGVQASTTGNIYGIYDMSGGSLDAVASYLNNGNANLTTNGTQILNANAMYKDVYTKNTIDSEDDNYALTSNRKGDAMYETSNSGSDVQIGAWQYTTGIMSNQSWPFISRGGGALQPAGIFDFDISSGGIGFGFHTILLVNPDL
jgi:hypothetical protein